MEAATPIAGSGATLGQPLAGIPPRRLRELGEALGRERSYLRAQLRAYEEARRTLSMAQHEESGPGGAPGDVATELAQEELVATLQRSDRARLAMVEAALVRVAADTYGRCGRCGLAIGYPRLRALPWTATCRVCASRPNLP